MPNEGYLIGYEDGKGNFVQIGQFNNAADDVTQPIEIVHTNSGETIGLSSSGTTVNNKTVALSRSHTVPTSYLSGPAHGEGASAFAGASILPDGRAVFAPYISSNVGLFDPSSNTYTSGPAHGENLLAFRGASILPDGRAVFAPYESSNVGLFDPSNNTYTSGPAHGEGGSAFQGVSILPDGRAVFAPAGSSNVGLFDPSDDTYESGPAHGEGGSAFSRTSILPDGRAVFAPDDSTNVGITSVIPAFANASSSKR